MPKISFIVARTDDDVIGCENKLPWNLPSDLKMFKRLTIGKIVIMGRKTFDSIGKPLPGRDNYVVSRSKDLNYPNVTVFSEVSTAILKATTESNVRGIDEIFVIGGQQIFDAAEREVDRVYLTQVHTTIGPKGDAHFEMRFPEGDWKLSEKIFHSKGPGDDFDFTFYVYDRKSKKRTGAAEGVNKAHKASKKDEFDKAKQNSPEFAFVS